MNRPEDLAAPGIEVEGGLRTLAGWAADVELDAIPAAVLRKAALIVTDNIAAMVAARDEPEVRRVHDNLLRDAARPDATVFRGGRQRTDRISAAMANGIAGCWCELDEGYRLASCHAALYALPAVLAEAEARGLTVAEMLRALVISYEVVSRCARCWPIPPLTVHPHPAWAAIAGAAAICAARRHSAATFLGALTSAATLANVGDYQHAIDGALVRNVWAGIGTANGMRAADWAEFGITGSPRSVNSIYTETLQVAPQPEYLASGLGTEWAVTRGFHKIHACCLSTHSAVEAALEARAEFGPRKSIDNIQRMVLETSKPGMSNPHPANSLAAKFSFEHVLATTQVHGHADAEAFAASTLNDSRVARLRGRVELRQYVPVLAPPHDRPARLTIHFDDGTKVAAEVLSARGGPDRPFEEQAILSKAERITDAVYPRFGTVMRDVMALTPSRLGHSWTHVVTEFAG